MLGSSYRLDRAQEAAYHDYAGKGIIRMSVELEDPGDRCAELDRALAHAP